MSLATQPDLASQLDYLARYLKNEVVGQDTTVDAVIETLERYSSGLADPRRPIGTFLFVGPSGVGKTFLVEQLARTAHHEHAFVRIDCSEYQQDHQVARLLGAPPGYYGAELGSVFANQILALAEPEKGCIILLDEIEKAHEKFFDLWLQVFDAARFTEGKGRTLDLSRALIFMTSNIGAEHHAASKDIGFRSQRAAGSNRPKVVEALKRRFRPEFLNRINHIAHFDPLTQTQQRSIFVRMLRDVNRKLRPYEIKVLLGERLHEAIFAKGFSQEYGARELSRTISDMLVTQLSKRLIKGDLPSDSLILADHDESGVFVASRIGDYPILMEETDIS